jgi:tetratricopeptide (TPR) repeat protein
MVRGGNPITIPGKARGFDPRKDRFMKIWLALLTILAAGPALAAPDTLSDAKALMADGRYSAAEQMLSGLAKQAPDADTLGALAEARLKTGDLDGATSACNDALDRDGKRADLWKLLGRIAFEHGNTALSTGDQEGVQMWYPDAATRYRKAMELDPKDPEPLCMIGWALEQQGKVDEAEKLYRQAIEKFPDAPDGYRRLGCLLARRADKTEGGLSDAAQAIRKQAVDVFEQGEKQAGPDAESLYYKGLALEWMRRKDDARKAYVAAIHADPELYKAWSRLSKAGASSGEMLALAQKVLETHPMSPTAASWAGFYMTQNGKIDAAIDLMLPVLEKHRENYPVYYSIVTAADRIRPISPDPKDTPEPEKWVATLEKLDEYYPFSGGPASNLGLYHRDVTKNVAEAKKWYDRALEKEPNSQNILNDDALMYLFYKKGEEQKKCLPMFQKVVSLVQDYGQAPDIGYWDALENLCKYYWEVERDPEKVIRYAEMRYKTTNGVAPYNDSRVARDYAAKAKAELGGK